ncbi:hypothetical protein DFH09DRAFT_1269451 [Mycena vulgaris]|nr:hypothetical protein DFH09DRAFT_1269451 [Mycena vulgaris]
MIYDWESFWLGLELLHHEPDLILAQEISPVLGQPSSNYIVQTRNQKVRYSKQETLILISKLNCDNFAAEFTFARSETERETRGQRKTRMEYLMSHGAKASHHCTRTWFAALGGVLQFGIIMKTRQRASCAVPSRTNPEVERARRPAHKRNRKIQARKGFIDGVPSLSRYVQIVVARVSDGLASPRAPNTAERPQIGTLRAPVGFRSRYSANIINSRAATTGDGEVNIGIIRQQRECTASGRTPVWKRLTPLSGAAAWALSAECNPDSGI